MNGLILNHHTAGVEDQLGCQGITILEVAVTVGLVAFIKLLLPNVRKSFAVK